MPITKQPAGRKGKPKSRFGAQLMEKQNLKGIYGIGDKQLKNYYKEARRSANETGPELITLLERRLDNAVYRSGMAQTRTQARQMTSHGLFAVNGRSVDVPSIQLKVGDVVSVKENKQKKSYFTNFEKKMQNVQIPDWLQLDAKNYSFQVKSIPTIDEAGLGVSIQEVVEFLAR